jgi:hypothetical protein
MEVIPGSLAGVDQFLQAPVVDHLILHPKVTSQVGNRPASLKRIHNLATELG